MAAGTKTRTTKEGRDRRQLNVRLDDEHEGLFGELEALALQKLGVKMNRSLLVRLALRLALDSLKTKSWEERRDRQAK